MNQEHFVINSAHQQKSPTGFGKDVEEGEAMRRDQLGVCHTGASFDDHFAAFWVRYDSQGGCGGWGGGVK